MSKLGIIGRKGSGKSYLTNFLKDENTQVIKFADPLKDMCRVMLTHMGFEESVIERMIEGDLKEERIPYYDITPRHMMQTLGTEWGRNCLREDIWGLIWQERVDQATEDGWDVICDDVRFGNEAIRARDLGFKLCRIISKDETSDSHPSEELTTEPMDFFVLNDKKPFNNKQNLFISAHNKPTDISYEELNETRKPLKTIDIS